MGLGIADLFSGLLIGQAACAYGGSPLKDNIADMKRGAEVIVCTPGRMIELLTTNSGRVINMRRVTYLVLDEADRMFDMGFEPQVRKLLQISAATSMFFVYICVLTFFTGHENRESNKTRPSNRAILRYIS